ncbi:MAG: sigma-70 family RNA polymerase sigma factor [Candidatus Nanopelagicales bacterium]
MTQHAWPPPDDQSAGEVLLAYWPALVRFARSITRDDALAQDLAQEAVVRAYEHRVELAEVRRIDSWMRRVVHNLAVDRARRDREIAVADVEERWRTDDYTVDAAEVVLAAETRVELEDALVRLPAIYRAAVVLHDAEGLTMREVADLAGIGLPAAKQRLRRGRMMLVTALAAGHERRERTREVPMSCWDARRRVSDYLDGDVDTATAERLRQHLAACPTCPPLLAALTGVRDLLGTIRDPDSVVDPALADRVRAALRVGHVDEPGVVPLERDGHGVGRAVSVLGDNQVGLPGAG